MSSDRTPTHIGHKAGCQDLLEHRVPVHVGQVGCTLNVTEAGQAALGVLGQELRTQGRGACLSCVPTEVRGVVRVGLGKTEVPLLFMLQPCRALSGMLPSGASPTLTSS